LPDENQIDGLTYQTIDKEAIRESWDKKDIYATGVILGLVLAIYLYFSFWI
jgi:SSS family solute:Na+ symporter